MQSSPAAIAIQAGALRENLDSGPDGVSVQSDIAYTIEARPEVQAVAFAQSYIGGFDGSMTGGDGPSPTLQATGGTDERGLRNPVILSNAWAVRRLTPTECERLQGFPDGYTAIPYRNKPAADGPRYKALGNSMAVNAMRWLGRRIELVNGMTATNDNTPIKAAA